MAMHGSHRLFVAVDPPAAVASALVSWGRAQRGRGTGMRVVAPEAVHLTLAFLGEHPAADVERVAGAMRAAVAEWSQAGGGVPVPLEVGAPAWLPPRRPRALVAEVRDPSGRLTDLRTALTGALEAAVAWSPQGRRFRPHLTVARLSGRRAVPDLLDPTPDRDFTVGAMVLYRSFLDPAGARYEELERVALC